MKNKWYTQWDECGKRIQAQRKRMGMSREQLAEQIDISAKNLGRIETGFQSTSVDTLYKISVVLNISIDYLLVGREKDMDEKTSGQVFEDKVQIGKILDHCSHAQLQMIPHLLRAVLRLYNLSDDCAGQDK